MAFQSNQEVLCMEVILCAKSVPEGTQRVDVGDGTAKMFLKEHFAIRRLKREMLAGNTV